MPALEGDLADQLPVALLTFDPLEDRILAANGAAARLLGPAARPGQRVSACFPAQGAAMVVFTQAVLDRGQGWTRDIAVNDASGVPCEVEIEARLLPGPGAPRILALLHDLRERQRRDLEREAQGYLRSGIEGWRRAEALFREIEQENRLILNAAGEGIFGVNAEGITTFLNPAAERILGWRAAEIVGRNMHSLVHHRRPDGSHYPDEDCPIYAAFRNGIVHEVDNEVFWRRDGAPIWVEYTSTPLLDGAQPVGAVVVFRDVSRRREAEERLRLALAEVDRLRQRLELENAYLQEEIRGDSHGEIVGRSAATQTVIRQVELVAPTDATVLITGESGTGKELIARAIHAASARRDRPLIRVNCAAIPRELFESEFFGHVKGAFTGALRDRLGRFELAHGGTLFLDEVGEIPLELQGKLLRVLQEGQFERVGEERTRDVDVRVIAATNRDLQAESRRGAFRRDLFFRLNVFPIGAVPLRDRPEDIPLIASHILANVGRKLRLAGLTLTQGHVQQLCGYEWPGNVRELENVIERAAILSREGRLRLDLPAAGPPAGPHPGRGAGADAGSGRAPPAAPAIETEAERHERDRANILAALEACGGRVFGPRGAAALLGLPPTTLASRMKRLGVPRR
ncbi:sigma 54-interacting transcriptional regulator [Roseomonas sp. NAR14]|uniref:Sigma 54-interacting transcriptional regulator n=1 Tax=Roseomonas acroporae TaxID=2937791 RepID=A0A9X2BX15_9PROT|nr:sigma 54-interacting transcriptional regulator [Roseomonas acroporae]MCK8786716.1 sigma 54-interacting transcriptional regulator [Roseomonas acroporae]